MKRMLVVALLLCPLWLAAQDTEIFIAQAPKPAQAGGTALMPRHRAQLRVAQHVGPNHIVFNRMPGGPRWWKNSELVQKVGVSDAQVQQIERIFQDSRLKLIDAKAGLEKQEVLLEPLIQADNPEEAKITSQIEKVAAARAELEKTNALMQVAIRRVLTLEQWKKLQSLQPQTLGPRRITVPLPPHAPETPAPPATPPNLE